MTEDRSLLPRALYAYDFPMSATTGTIKLRHFPYRLWEERYLPLFSEITVVGRTRQESPDATRFPASNGPGLRFAALPDLAHPLRQVILQSTARRGAQKLLRTSDILIARLPSETGSLAAAAAIKAKHPWIAEVVGCPFDGLWNHGSLAAKVWAPIAARRLRRLLRYASGVIYVTSDFLQSRYPTKAPSVSCANVTLRGIDQSAFERRRIPDRTDVIHIGLLGYLGTDQKGADTAIRALAMLPHLNVILHLAGGGDSSRLKALARRKGVYERVNFLGQIPHDQVWSWLDGLDLYLQPSRQEGLPRALIEAMSRGCPALGSTAGGIPELLPLDSTHPPGAWRVLGALIDEKLSSPTWLKTASIRNLEVAAEFEHARLNMRRLEFIRSVLESHH